MNFDNEILQNCIAQMTVRTNLRLAAPFDILTSFMRININDRQDPNIT